VPIEEGIEFPMTGIVPALTQTRRSPLAGADRAEATIARCWASARITDGQISELASRGHLAEAEGARHDREQGRCTALNLPADVLLVDVAPRDGLQNEAQPVDADAKIALVNDLARAACAGSK
jgi:hypothetical protein